MLRQGAIQITSLNGTTQFAFCWVGLGLVIPGSPAPPLSGLRNQRCAFCMHSGPPQNEFAIDFQNHSSAPQVPKMFPNSLCSSPQSGFHPKFVRLHTCIWRPSGAEIMRCACFGSWCTNTKTHHKQSTSPQHLQAHANNNKWNAKWASENQGHNTILHPTVGKPGPHAGHIVYSKLSKTRRPGEPIKERLALPAARWEGSPPK